VGQAKAKIAKIENEVALPPEPVAEAKPAAQDDLMVYGKC
jgi:hypothetical protein